MGCPNEKITAKKQRPQRFYEEGFTFYAPLRLKITKLALKHQKMPAERLCPSCKTWNTDQDFCTKCNTTLSPEIIEDAREEERENRRINTPPTPLDTFLDKWKNNRFLVIRVLYKIVYTIWVIFMTIAGLFTYLAASPNG